MGTVQAEYYAPVYGRKGFSNHFPMAKYALEQLGADHARLQEFTKNELSHLDLLDISKPFVEITDDNFESYLGKKENYLGYYNYFRDRVVLNEALPRIDQLAKGISASAFHALIRLSYGIGAEDRSEVAAGLAYLADSNLVLIPERAGLKAGILENFSDLGAEVLSLCQSGELEALPSKNSISDRMQLTVEEPKRGGIISRVLHVSDPTLEDLAKLSLRIFLHTNNFTALHAVTGSHAARLVLPYVDDQERFAREFAIGVFAAVITIPRQDFHREIYNPDEKFESLELIKPQAVASQDSHDIKFIYSCWQEYLHYQDRDYITAAQLKVQDR